MAAEIWALFGLMAAALGVLATSLFFAIGLDDLRSDTNSRFDTLHAEMNSRFDTVRAEMNGRFDTQHEDVREVRLAIGNVDRRLTAAGG